MFTLIFSLVALPRSTTAAFTAFTHRRLKHHHPNSFHLERNKFIHSQYIMSMSSSSDNLKFVDIGANLLDPMFKGIYRSKERHEGDFDLVLERSWENHVKKIVITAGTLEESKNALELSKQDSRLYSTVGVHPTRCTEIENDDNIIKELTKICHDGIKAGKVKALGMLIKSGVNFQKLLVLMSLMLQQ